MPSGDGGTGTERINRQVVDLREVFCKQHDVRGSTSIKTVPPVLCPELSYEGLAIREGATASDQWWEMVSGEGGPQKRLDIAEVLRACCKLDMYAIYAVWRVLHNHCFGTGGGVATSTHAEFSWQ